MRGCAEVPIAVIDHRDSFTHNMVHALERAGARCTVLQADRATVSDVLDASFRGLLLSAGPCTPAEAGVSLELVRALVRRPCPTPLLGICLGHQTLAVALGGRVRRSARPSHGKTCEVTHDDSGPMAGLPSPLSVVRYNSLVVDADSLPPELRPCAWDDQGELMAAAHRRLPLWGVQFHPESWMAGASADLLGRWVASLGARRDGVARDAVVVQAPGR